MVYKNISPVLNFCSKIAAWLSLKAPWASSTDDSGPYQWQFHQPQASHSLAEPLTLILTEGVAVFHLPSLYGTQGGL